MTWYAIALDFNARIDGLTTSNLVARKFSELSSQAAHGHQRSRSP